MYIKPENAYSGELEALYVKLPSDLIYALKLQASVERSTMVALCQEFISKGLMVREIQKQDSYKLLENGSTDGNVDWDLIN